MISSLAIKPFKPMQTALPPPIAAALMAELEPAAAPPPPEPSEPFADAPEPEPAAEPIVVVVNQALRRDDTLLGSAMVAVAAVSIGTLLLMALRG